jgi:hypothetical protein
MAGAVKPGLDLDQGSCLSKAARRNGGEKIFVHCANLTGKRAWTRLVADARKLLSLPTPAAEKQIRFRPRVAAARSGGGTFAFCSILGALNLG